MFKIPPALRSPRAKKYGLAAAFVLASAGAYPLIYSDLPGQVGPEYHSDAMAMPATLMPTPAGRGMSHAMTARSAPVSSKAMATEAAPGAAMDEDRRLQETHNFTLTGDRDRIPEHYEAAMAACIASFCEILSGSLNDYGSRLEARASLRVDRDRFDEVVRKAGVGSPDLELVNHERSSQDRTRQYQDIEARMQSQMALRSRLMSLLDSPTTRKTSDILEIEREIARTQGQIESLDAQRRSIEEVTDRTTVHLTFRNDRLDAAPAHPPYLANAFKEAGTIFERSLAKLVRLAAGVSPIMLFGGLAWLLAFRAIPVAIRKIRAIAKR